MKRILIIAAFCLAIALLAYAQIGTAPTGSAPIGNPTLIAGWDGTNVRTLSTDTSGRVNTSQANIVGSTDPCQNPNVLKSSAKVALSSTTAQAVVALSSGKITYVCGFSATIQGSATTVGTLQFEYGTQTTNPCDTGATTLTSPFAGNITANVPTLVTSPGGGFTNFATIASNQLCAVATGTTISVQGYVTYVQQ